MKKVKVSLQPSEAVVFQVAGRIYSAYLASGRVEDGQEPEWMKRSLQEAITLAQLADATLQSDTELD
jgi:hypothetical protein